MYYKRKSKIKKCILIFAAVLTVLVIAFLAMQTAKERKSYRTISVVEVSGRVGVVKDGMEYSAYPGMRLQEGYEMITSGDSFVRLVLDGDKYVKLEPGSKLVFETLGLLGTGKTRLCLERGSLTTEVTKPLGAEEEFIVNTPNAILAVRGTFFRVEIKNLQEGDVISRVLTYGGQVASKRIMPDGEVKDEEVLIDAGFKTTINKTAVDTVYVVKDTSPGTAGTDENTLHTEPIVQTDISDEDLIDLYFAAENGHGLFLTAEEAKRDIQERRIDLINRSSVYEKAQEMLENTVEPEMGTDIPVTSAIVANDSYPLQRVEEKDTDKAQDAEDADIQRVTGPITDGTGETAENVHEHREIFAGQELVHSKCAECGGVLSKTHEYQEMVVEEATCTVTGKMQHTCLCGYHYVTEIEMLAHVEVKGGTKECHSKCKVCDEILSTGHKLVETITKQPTCTEKGSKEFACACGYGYSEEIAQVDHSETNAGTVGVHSKCGICGVTMKDGAHHTYTVTRTEASCNGDGATVYECICGYRYEEKISAIGHREVTGGEEKVHVKCGNCGETLEDGSYHEISEISRMEPTCTVDGVVAYECDCGYGYEELLPAPGHEVVKGATDVVHSKCDACGEILEDGSFHSYTDTITQASCTTEGKIVHECSCGYRYEEMIPATGHTTTLGKEENVHSKCGICGVSLEDGSYHSFSRTTIDATCTAAGSILYECTCEYSYEETIPATGHTEVAGGGAGVHLKCNTCGITLEDGNYHVTAEVSRREATCTEDGVIIYGCDCGYEYSNTILATGHTEVPGGKKDAHTKCSTCDETILDGNYHGLGSTITDATCTQEGLGVYSCSCGYGYEEVIPAKGHTKMNEMSDWTYCAYCGETWVVVNASTFPDDAFREYVLQTFDINGDGELFGGEMTAVVTLDVSGTAETDGGIFDLTGIEYFTEITSLDCSYNSGLTYMDLNMNTKLTTLDCSATGITDLSSVAGAFGRLETFSCNDTPIVNIDPSLFQVLKTLNCRNTQITSINLSGSPLETLDISGNTLLTEAFVVSTGNLVTLIVDDCRSLVTGEFYTNASLRTISIKNATSMETFRPLDNPWLTSIDLSGSYAIVNSIDMYNSGSSSGSLTVTATDTGLTTNSFLDWNDSYMTLVE